MLKGLRFCVLGCLMVAALSSSAQVFTLTDTGTSAVIDTQSDLGIKDWFIGGIDQAFRSTYTWRVGDATASDAIQNLTQLSAVQTGTRFLDVAYVNVALGFRIDTTYILTGGLSTFDIAEITRVTNIGNQSLDFRLFQYNDFDLNGTNANDSATRLNSSQIQQVDGAVTLNFVSEGATPVPTFSQVSGLFFSNLTTIAGFNMDSPAGSNIGQNFTGDAAYGYQWNFSINPGQSFTISTDKVAAVPEPATLAALAIGAAALLRRRRGALNR
jgi:hypothetical protein